MPRTTSAQVEKLVEVDSNIDVEPFIETASAIVDDVCAPLGYNSTRLELIERWLAAHFYTIRDNRSASESVGKGAASQSFQYQVGLFLKNSMQGQQAMLLDTKGGLAKLDKKMETGAFSVDRDITWMGDNAENEVTQAESAWEADDTNA